VLDGFLNGLLQSEPVGLRGKTGSADKKDE
jgi:hypothetical protein